MRAGKYICSMTSTMTYRSVAFRPAGEEVWRALASTGVRVQQQLGAKLLLGAASNRWA